MNTKKWWRKKNGSNLSPWDYVSHMIRMVYAWNMQVEEFDW